MWLTNPHGGTTSPFQSAVVSCLSLATFSLNSMIVGSDLYLGKVTEGYYYFHNIPDASYQ